MVSVRFSMRHLLVSSFVGPDRLSDSDRAFSHRCGMDEDRARVRRLADKLSEAQHSYDTLILEKATSPRIEAARQELGLAQKRLAILLPRLASGE
jgi:hypothetical protein